MRGRVAETLFFINRDPTILIVPFLHQFADGPAYQLRQIPDDESGVLPCEFNLSTEGQVIAYKDLCPGGDACWEGFVVAITKTQHPAVVVTTGDLGLNFHEPEISGTVMRQAVSRRCNCEVGNSENFLDVLNQLQVWDRRPRFRGARSRDGLNLTALDAMRPAVEN